jgi:hypothetical protein
MVDLLYRAGLGHASRRRLGGAEPDGVSSFLLLQPAPVSAQESLFIFSKPLCLDNEVRSEGKASLQKTFEDGWV